MYPSQAPTPNIPNLTIFMKKYPEATPNIKETKRQIHVVVSGDCYLIITSRQNIFELLILPLLNQLLIPFQLRK